MAIYGLIIAFKMIYMHYDTCNILTQFLCYILYLYMHFFSVLYFKWVHTLPCCD